jgi:hypothetical protein
VEARVCAGAAGEGRGGRGGSRSRVCVCLELMAPSRAAAAATATRQVPSRTVVQIRTHAQKYFQKLHKREVRGRAAPRVCGGGGN